MPVDSFKYVSRLVARYYRLSTVDERGPIPWTPLAKPLDRCRFALITSGGLYDKRKDPPFDLARETREPSWGDPSYRVISVDVPPAEIGATHQYLRLLWVKWVNILVASFVT